MRSRSESSKSFVLRALPETAARVLSGDVPLDEAYAIAAAHERELKDRNQKKALLKAKAPDLYDLVEDERLPLDDAIASLEARQTRKEIHEARQVRDAEKSDPGIVRRVLDEKLAAGQEPTKAALREAVIEAARQGIRGDAPEGRSVR
mgnify:CR=1 FL=1